MANEQNLKSWQPGQSGNPAGKPKGTKHLSKWIQEMLEDENFEVKLKGRKTFKGAPMQAVIQAVAIKALSGDLRAFDLLAKYGYGTKVDVTSDGKPMPRPLLGGLSVAPPEQVAQYLDNRGEKSA